MTNYPGYTLHQISPYIGKIRPLLARELIQTYSSEDDLVWDPFCGSGTIPLESKLLNRNVIAADINPYAYALTMAKLHAPKTPKAVISNLDFVVQKIKTNSNRINRVVPQWVKNFFHEQTLNETLFLISEFLIKKQYFNIGCLLGILHHQRPGFLSYPASHLVPYLRDRKYPQHLYPEAYKYRDPIPRLKAKINRVLKSPPPKNNVSQSVFKKSATIKYLPDKSVDIVITSPPYMSALDYARDNRLRLWFLGVENYRIVQNMEIRKISSFNEKMRLSLIRIAEALKPNGLCVLVIGDLSKNNKTYNIPEMIQVLVREKNNKLSIIEKWTDWLPNQRRTRKNGRATKKETIMVFKRE